MDIKNIVSHALPIIFSNEGNYGSVNKDDCGAVSIGKIQWHGNRALNLLNRIVKANKSEAKIKLGYDLYNEVIKSRDWSRRIVTKSEAKDISYLLTTTQGKEAQDQQASDDVAAYIKNGIKLGIKDYKALIYYADVENQGGAGASKRIGQAAIKKAGKKNVTLDIYHSCALIDKVMSQYAQRRCTVYNKCRVLNIYAKPVKTITAQSSENDIAWLQVQLNKAFKPQIAI
jgi:hypothetical protein